MKFQQSIFIIAIIWYSFTAYFSIGYFHPDEHYQIIEFAGIIDGSNTAEDLPWEYNARIRPALQPTIAYIVFSTCNLFSINNPFILAFTLRLLMGFISVIVIYFFTNSCRKWIKPKYWKIFLFISYFMWFLPFINVRFSSETFSGILLLLATAILIKGNSNLKTNIILGGLFGLSFLFRFQIAIAVLGIILWLIIIKKETLLNLSIIVFSGLIVLVFGLLLDFWFYSEITIPFWNYLNTFRLSPADRFGLEPWYYYFTHSILYSFFPLGIIIFGSFILMIYKKPKSVFIWIILPFFIIHSFIGHKELRFLFPIINFIPIILILATQELEGIYILKRNKIFIKGILILILIFNLTAVSIISFVPAGMNSRVKLAKIIQEFTATKKVNLYFVEKSNPYYPWSLKTNFYKNPNVITKEIDLSNIHDITTSNSNEINLLSVRQIHLNTPEIQNFIKRHKMHEETKAVPEFIFPLLEIINKSDKAFSLYSE